MKQVSSFFRFLLVLIGSFFLAIGIMIVNACRNAVRSVSAYVAPQTQTQMDSTRAETASRKPDVVTLNLKDGTKITGEASAGSVELQTGFGKIAVLLAKLKQLQFDHNGGTATAYMTDGSILTGTFIQKEFDIKAKTGKISLNIDRIDSIIRPDLTETISALLTALASQDPKENQRGAEGLAAIGQDAVPKLKEAFPHISKSSYRDRVIQVFATLGWYVTQDGAVEKMSESREFQEMMRKRLPEMQAE
jgi:hypothetical protein